MNSNQDISPEDYFGADQPIEGRKQDRLGRRSFAEAIARRISRAPVKQGFTIAITGEWGSGKTSMLIMVEEALLEERDDVAVLQFNPWLFEGTIALVTRFFREVGAQLGQYKFEGIGEIAKGFAELGRELAPLIPIPGTNVVAWAFAKLGSIFSSKPVSLHIRRDQLKEALSKSKKRLVVFVDDIDRLESSEIREIMRLVRLTSDLPNVVFLLAFDRRRVAGSLGDVGRDVDGQVYLEKIVQECYHLPVVREVILSETLTEHLDELIKGRDLTQLDTGVWARVLYDVIRPLLRNLRDVKRYLNPLPVTLDMVGNEVALADLLGLEAIRILRPNIFDALKAHPEYLVHSNSVALLSMSDSNRADVIKQGLQAMLKQAGDDKKILESLLEILFPATNGYLGQMSHGPNFNSTWRAKRRVASEEVLQIYLHAGLDEGVLRTRDVQDLIEALNDEAKLQTLLDDMDSQHLENALDRLLDFEHDFPLDAVPIAVPVLVNLMGRLSDAPTRGLLGVPLRSKASILVSILLRRMGNSEALLDCIPAMLKKVHTLSGWLDLIETVGHHESVGRRLVTEDHAKELERNLVERLESSTANELTDEWDLYALCYRTLKFFDGVDEDRLAARLRRYLSNDGFVLTVLHTATVYRTTNGHTEKLLSWDGLLEVFGEAFEFAVKRLASSPNYDDFSPEDQEVMGLAQEFASGLRPKRWFRG